MLLPVIVLQTRLTGVSAVPGVLTHPFYLLSKPRIAPVAFGKTIALAAALRHRGSVCLRSPKNNIRKRSSFSVLPPSPLKGDVSMCAAIRLPSSKLSESERSGNRGMLCQVRVRFGSGSGGERECKGSAFWGNTQGGGAKKYVFLAYVCFFLYLCSPI